MIALRYSASKDINKDAPTKKQGLSFSYKCAGFRRVQIPVRAKTISFLR